MQRLIEQPTGEGEVLEGNAAPGRVHYSLSVYQQFSDVEDEPVPASFTVEGRVIPVDAIDLRALRHRRADVMLRLTDGRLLTCSITSMTGSYAPPNAGCSHPNRQARRSIRLRIAAVADPARRVWPSVSGFRQCTQPVIEIVTETPVRRSTPR